MKVCPKCPIASPQMKASFSVSPESNEPYYEYLVRITPIGNEIPEEVQLVISVYAPFLSMPALQSILEDVSFEGMPRHIDVIKAEQINSEYKKTSLANHYSLTQAIRIVRTLKFKGIITRTVVETVEL